MKRSTSLLLLMLAPGLGGECFAFSNRAAVTSVLREERGAYPVYENGSKAQIIAIEEKSHSDETKLPRTGPINELEAKRLKLILLLMMSPGKYRTPVH